ncbi:MAG: DegV family protein [Candidatus Heimdallarchaeota archaeon]|nr:DegV family protein [Candidatus Heimdallarchaeota archaeon]
MSSKIALITDGGADLSAEKIKEFNVHSVVEVYVLFGEEQHTAKTMTIEDFHKRVNQTTKKTFPKTSQPSPHDFLVAYEKAKEDGFETIISVHLSSKLSGTFNSANLASKEIEGIDIRVIDSFGVSPSLAACVKYASKLISQGIPVDDIEQKIIEFGKTLQGFIAFNTLDNLLRGGRMSPVRYRLGKLLNIKPVIRLANGELKPFAKAKGIDKSRTTAYGLSTENYSKDKPVNYIIAHTRAKDLALEYEKKLKTEFPNATGFVMEIGIVISTHAGENALFFMVYEEP